MASADQSTKVCARCRKDKALTAFPTSRAKVCIDCENAQSQLDEHLKTAPKPPKKPSKRALALVSPPEMTEEEKQFVDPAPFVDVQAEVDINSPTAQELAARTLARRRLLHFVQRFRPKYMAGWVHEDICRRLERFMRDVEEGKEPRMLLCMPVRHGKSEICSRHFAAWVLGHHPDWEIIAASGAQSLALSFSRYMRDLMRSDSYQAVFPDSGLDPESSAVENWSMVAGGGYLAAGVGTMITGRGAHCLAGNTLVSTVAGQYRLDTLYLLQYPPLVNTPLGPRRIMAMTKRKANRVYKLRFASGIELHATGEHPIYLPDEKRYVTVEEIYGKAQSSDRLGLLVLRQAVSTSEVRGGQSSPQRSQGFLLREGVFGSAPRDKEREVVSDMRQAGGFKRECAQCEVLQQGVSPEPCSLDAETLSSVRRGISAEKFKAGLLRGDLREYGAHNPYAWGGELELQDGQTIRVFVRPDETSDIGARQGLCGVQNEENALLPPHQRGSERQCAGELGDAVQGSPSGASQVAHDAVSVVERGGEGSYDVYDIQVEEAGCFFANDVLVGNCLIIDDPVKDAEAADSQVIRDNVWEWYISTALSRLAPGGGVLCVMTHWNEDDLAGRLQLISSMEDGGDKFEVVKYPAINDRGDEYILPDDSIEQFADGTLPPEGSRLMRPKNTALHPARYTLESLLRRKATYFALGQQRWWSALYQQAPSPDEGVYFSRDLFQFYSTPPDRRDVYIYQAWDFAISESQQSDYTVCVTGAVDHRDAIHILDVTRFKTKDGVRIAETIVRMASEWNAVCIGVEDGQIWKTMESQFLKACSEARYYPAYEALKPLTDKMVRASPLKGRMQSGKVFFDKNAPWWPALEEEFLRFPAGKHDDQVDAAAWLTRLTLGRTAPPQKIHDQKVKSWKDRLGGMLQGAGGSHMAS